MAPGRRGSLALPLGCAVAAFYVLQGSGAIGEAFALLSASSQAGRPTLPSQLSWRAAPTPGVGGSSAVAAAAAVLCLAAAAHTAAIKAYKRSAQTTVACRATPAAEDIETASRRSAAFVAFAAGSLGAAAPSFAEAQAPIEIDLPPKINQDPYELLQISDPDNAKQDKNEFFLKRNYKEDTYQLVKHMKISASIDKGTPNMERFQKRIKEEMNDWVALYRRQDSVVGRQSYYSLYSAVNTLSSHLASYGPKFPFPNKRRPRFYQLIAQTEKYLEKGK